MIQKKCTRCGTIKPATTEFFYKRGRGDELRSECKICRLQDDRSPQGKSRYKKYYSSAHGKKTRKLAAEKETYKSWARNWMQKRRTLKKLLPSTLTNEQWQATLLFFNNACSYCGRKEEVLHQDHFIPLVANGGFTADNIVPACGKCNRTKHARMPEKWCNPETYEKIAYYLSQQR